MGKRHFLVVDSDEVGLYQRSVKERGLEADILTMDEAYRESYETCDDLGDARSKGPGPKRNFAWAHAIASGARWHWVMDDNINGFFRMNQNRRLPCRAPGFWSAMEDWCNRYTNLVMAGPFYFNFAPPCVDFPPVILNTRIYSCNLIRNDIRQRWRGRYNEDTILSLDILKAGLCTAQFFAFLQNKLATQVMPGGNTADFYHKEGEKRERGEAYAKGGTDEKTLHLKRLFPDIVKVVHKYGRTHHLIDYKRLFKGNVLRRRKDISRSKGANEYGMRLDTR